MRGTVYQRKNMKRILLTFVITCLLCSSYSAEAQQRAAFVVGNNDYREYPLKNAVNDANLMEATLQRLGFTVKKVLNASKTDFERQMMDFNRDFGNADIRFFIMRGMACSWKDRTTWCRLMPHWNRRRMQKWNV